MPEIALNLLTIVIGIGSLVMLVIGPCYFAVLRKVLRLAKEIDPSAWAAWGRPENLTDLSYRQNRSLMRAIGGQVGVNRELMAHPAFKRARWLYWTSAAILFLMFGTILVTGLNQLNPLDS